MVLSVYAWVSQRCLDHSFISSPPNHLNIQDFYPCPPTFLDSVFHNFNKCLANFNKHISVATNFCSFAFSSHLWGRFSIPGKPKHLLFHYLQPGSLASVEKADSPTTSNQPQWGPGRWQSGTHTLASKASPELAHTCWPWWHRLGIPVLEDWG